VDIIAPQLTLWKNQNWFTLRLCKSYNSRLKLILRILNTLLFNFHYKPMADVRYWKSCVWFWLKFHWHADTSGVPNHNFILGATRSPNTRLKGHCVEVLIINRQLRCETHARTRHTMEISERCKLRDILELEVKITVSQVNRSCVINTASWVLSSSGVRTYELLSRKSQFICCPRDTPSDCFSVSCVHWEEEAAPWDCSIRLKNTACLFIPAARENGKRISAESLQRECSRSMSQGHLPH
jgi:hypothetical protein